MAFSNTSPSALLRTPTALEQLLEEINFQRTKEMRQLLKDGKAKILNSNEEDRFLFPAKYDIRLL